MLEAIIACCLVVGGSFTLIGSIGLARLPDLFTRLLGLYVGSHLVLLICIPLAVTQQGELAGEVADRFEVSPGEAQNAVGFHNRNRR